MPSGDKSIAIEDKCYQYEYLQEYILSWESRFLLESENIQILSSYYKCQEFDKMWEIWGGGDKSKNRINYFKSEVRECLFIFKLKHTVLIRAELV